MNENNLNLLGRKLRLLRQTQALNQAAIAAKLGVSTPAYNKIETGVTDVNISRLKQIAELYKVPITVLLNGDDDPHARNTEEEIKTLKTKLGQKLEEVSMLQAKCIALMDELMSKEN